MKKIVIGLSGGMDSATLLGILLEQGMEVHCCSFYYGSKHNKYENKAAKNIIDFYQLKGFPVFGYPMDLNAAFSTLSSNLLLSGEEIPEGHYAADIMKKTVVPGRNLVFASVMASLAESIKAEAIALGVHAGDHHIYPDCRMEFIKALDTAIYLSSDKTVEIITPLIKDTKTSILTKGLALPIPVPYELTRTCYKNQPLACGKCGSCIERLEAFSNLKLKDPVKYD